MTDIKKEHLNFPSADADVHPSPHWDNTQLNWHQRNVAGGIKPPFLTIHDDETQEMPPDTNGWIRVIGGTIKTEIYDSNGKLVITRGRIVESYWKKP